MNAKQLIAHFDRISDAPNAVDRMRRFIRDLAARGKAVRQDPTDEPASELLRCLEDEKQQRVKSGSLRKKKPLATIHQDEPPYGLPHNWAWTRLGTCTLVTEYGTSVRSSATGTGIPVLGMADVQDAQVLLGDKKTVPADIKDLPRLLLKKDDLLFNRTNSAELVGKTGIYVGENDQYTFASYLIRLRFLKEFTDPAYINLVMNAPFFRETQIRPQTSQQTGQANVNGTKLRNMLIPLPPAGEQKRIVAKVEELMAICDELEETQTTRERRRDRLATTSQRRLVQATADPEAFRTCAGFYLDRLPRLTTRPEQISELRRTIVTLALGGKLVAPSTNYSSVDERLKDILTGMEALTVGRRQGVWKQSSPVASEGEPRGAPTHWARTTINETGLYINGIAFKPSDWKPSGMRIVRIQNLSDASKVFNYAEGSFPEDNVVRDGDLLVSWSATLDVFIWDRGAAVVNQHIFKVVRNDRAVTRDYLYWLLKTEIAKLASGDHMRGLTMRHIRRGPFLNHPIALPPLEEQERIVAKIGQFMDVCDELESLINNCRSTRARLLEAVLHEALQEAS